MPDEVWQATSHRVALCRQRVENSGLREGAGPRASCREGGRVGDWNWQERMRPNRKSHDVSCKAALCGPTAARTPIAQETSSSGNCSVCSSVSTCHGRQPPCLSSVSRRPVSNDLECLDFGTSQTWPPGNRTCGMPDGETAARPAPSRPILDGRAGQLICTARACVDCKPSRTRSLANRNALSPTASWILLAGGYGATPVDLRPQTWLGGGNKERTVGPCQSNQEEE